MKKYLLVICLVPIALWSSEPSAFGAGDLESDTPYGLTESEQYILKNKQRLENIKKETRMQDGKVESIRERMDGLQTVVEGLSVKSHQNRLALEALSGELSNDGENSLKAKVDQNSEDILKLKEALQGLSQLLDTIHSNYLTKDDYNMLVDEVNDLKESLTKTLKSSKGSRASLSTMSNQTVAQKAQAFFNKKYYTDAITYYEHLIKKNYKPAYAYYMIGEMNFRRKKYKEALSYFKESASRYDKAKYMPNLMLHSAISMEKMGDGDNAQSFYDAIVAKYPNSKAAKEAKKRMQ